MWHYKINALPRVPSVISSSHLLFFMNPWKERTQKYTNRNTLQSWINYLQPHLLRKVRQTKYMRHVIKYSSLWYYNISCKNKKAMISKTWLLTNEPSHEIMALFILRKFILQMSMCRHPVGLDVWFLVGPFIYFHTLCVRTVKALARLGGCAGSPEPLLVAYAISTIISLAQMMLLQHSICYWSTDIKQNECLLNTLVIITTPETTTDVSCVIIIIMTINITFSWIYDLHMVFGVGCGIVSVPDHCLFIYFAIYNVLIKKDNIQDSLYMHK